MLVGAVSHPGDSNSRVDGRGNNLPVGLRACLAADRGQHGCYQPHRPISEKIAPAYCAAHAQKGDGRRAQVVTMVGERKANVGS